MPLSAGTHLGPYEILAALGAGGMGEVYRARDTRLNRDVALKVLPESFAHDPERMARFEREAHVLASLNHPHIATVYGFEAGAIGMELVEGPTLAERIGGRAMPLDEALPIALQIAEGLEYAHEKGIIHRDLKPANVKLTPDGTVKILDFGLAKALETPTAQGNPSISPTLTLEGTRAGVILGTATYMAPEQARGAVVDKRADIWAFGVVLYEMLTGKQPFAGATVSDTLAAVLKTEPDWDAIPAKLRRLVHRCLEKNPRLRLRDIGEARVLLAGSAEDLPTSPAPPTKTHWWLRLSPWLAAALLLTTLAISWIHFRGTPAQQAAIRFTVSPPEKATFADPFAVSPDGLRLALVVNTPGSGQSLWVRRLDSLDSQPLSGTEGADQPFWSPDSRFIAFFAQGKLKKVEASGGPALALSDAPAGIRGSWSREGTIIFNPVNRGPLFRVSAEGGAATQITTVDHSLQEDGHRYPQFLPDGRHFLYYAESIGDPTNERIY
jgi:serine/threonine protein kinase